MKKISFLLLFFVATSINAQYEFTVLNESYEDLDGGTSLNNGQIWDDPSFTVPLGFDFQLSSNVINSIFFGDDTAGGELTTVLDTDNEIFGFIAAVGQDLIDRGFDANNSISPLSFLTEGQEGSKILKIEWNNAGFFSDDTAQDFINFQVWLYEEDNSIEYRYGPSQVSSPDNSFDGAQGIRIRFAPLFDAAQNELVDDAYVLDRDPLDPNFIVVGTIAAGEALGDVALIGTPPEGTVYRFSLEALSVDDTAKERAVFDIYPNPTNDVFKVQSAGIDYKLEIYSISGQRVMIFDNAQDVYNISNLSRGVYMAKITSAAGEDTQRLIRN